jgi:hypothetical protein
MATLPPIPERPPVACSRAPARAATPPPHDRHEGGARLGVHPRSVLLFGGPILLSLVVALVLIPSAAAYQVANTLNETAHVYSMGVGEIRCPSRAEWSEDWASSYGWSYTNVREDYTVLGPVVCAGALGIGGADVPAWQQALGVLVLTHEAFHLRHWRFRRNEGKVECQALANFRDAARRLGATPAQVEDLYPYALALHDYKIKLFPQYRDPNCVIPPWAPPTTIG